MAKTAAPTNTAPAATVITVGLRVVSMSPSGVFRRAGFTFSRLPVVVPMSLLTPEQADAIRATPMLDVTEVDIEPAAPVTPAAT